MTTDLYFIATAAFAFLGFGTAFYLWVELEKSTNRITELRTALKEAEEDIAVLHDALDALQGKPDEGRAVSRGGFGSTAAKHAPRGRRKIKLDDDETPSGS